MDECTALIPTRGVFSPAYELWARLRKCDTRYLNLTSYQLQGNLPLTSYQHGGRGESLVPPYPRVPP